MKTHKLKIIVLAFGAVFLTSCTSLLYTSLDVLRPAKIAFAPEANDLLIVNNTITQPDDYGHKTTLLNDRPKNIRINTDSLAIFCLAAFTEELQTKDFFSTVQLIPNSVNSGNNFADVAPIHTNKVYTLSQIQNANVILSLDRIKVNDDLSEYFFAESNSYLGVLELRYETSWSIHYPNEKEFQTMQFKDTVFWESESYVRRRAIGELPDRTNALVDGALYVGQKTVNRFIPYWEKVDRYFFNPGNKLMRQAMDSVYVKNWEAAINLWEKAAENSSSQYLKAQADNNIAIGYEILGDIDKALEYATSSLYSLGTLTFSDFQQFSRVSEYVLELTQRKRDIALIKKQLGE
jgi:tetratricopeptide (TPR) repeat protein